jgi:hypothetical protein
LGKKHPPKLLGILEWYVGKKNVSDGVISNIPRKHNFRVSIRLIYTKTPLNNKVYFHVFHPYVNSLVQKLFLPVPAPSFSKCCLQATCTT